MISGESSGRGPPFPGLPPGATRPLCCCVCHPTARRQDPIIIPAAEPHRSSCWPSARERSRTFQTPSPASVSPGSPASLRMASLQSPPPEGRRTSVELSTVHWMRCFICPDAGTQDYSLMGRRDRSFAATQAPAGHPGLGTPCSSHSPPSNALGALPRARSSRTTPSPDSSAEPSSGSPSPVLLPKPQLLLFGQGSTV